MVVPTASWPAPRAVPAARPGPGWARPSTPGGADRGKVVDGRHKAGHDTGEAGPAMLQQTARRLRRRQVPPFVMAWRVRAMTGKKAGSVSTYPRFAVAPMRRVWAIYAAAFGG